jgi:hypothetical protein
VHIKMRLGGDEAIVRIGQRAIRREQRRFASCKKRLQAGVFIHAKAAAERINAQAIHGERYELAALEAEQGARVAGHEAAQRTKQAPEAFGLRQVTGQVVHEGQQGGQDRIGSGHGDSGPGRNDTDFEESV